MATSFSSLPSTLFSFSFFSIQTQSGVLLSQDNTPRTQMSHYALSWWSMWRWHMVLQKIDVVYRLFCIATAKYIIILLLSQEKKKQLEKYNVNCTDWICFCVRLFTLISALKWIMFELFLSKQVILYINVYVMVVYKCINQKHLRKEEEGVELFRCDSRRLQKVADFWLDITYFDCRTKDVRLNDTACRVAKRQKQKKPVFKMILLLFSPLKLYKTLNMLCTSK